MLEMLALPFVQRALGATLLGAPLLGALSPLVVARRMAFFSAVVAQAALTGVSLGVLLGEPLDSPYAGVFGACTSVAVVLTYLRRRARVSPDALMGVMLAGTLALSVCLLVLVTQRFNIHQLESAMFGSVLTVMPKDLVFLGATALLGAVLLGRHMNALFAASVDGAAAKARGVPTALLDYGFGLGLALAVVVTVKLFGALLVEAMVVVPAVAARQWARSAKATLVWSTALATFAGVLGVLLSAAVNVPPGAAAVLALCAVFAASHLGPAGR